MYTAGQFYSMWLCALIPIIQPPGSNREYTKQETELMFWVIGAVYSER